MVQYEFKVGYGMWLWLKAGSGCGSVWGRVVVEVDVMLWLNVW